MSSPADASLHAPSYVFTPRPDITPFELARLVPLLLAQATRSSRDAGVAVLGFSGIVVSEPDLVRQLELLPEAEGRHFERLARHQPWAFDSAHAVVPPGRRAP